MLEFVKVGKLDDVVRTREVTQNLLGENSILLSIVICQSKIMHMDFYDNNFKTILGLALGCSLLIRKFKINCLRIKSKNKKGESHCLIFLFKFH